MQVHVWNLRKKHFLRITPLVPYGNPLGWKQDPDLHGLAGPLQAEVLHDTASQQVPGEPLQTVQRTKGLPPTCVAWGEKHSKLFYFLHFIKHSIITQLCEVIRQKFSPLHAFSTNGVPFVTDLAQQVVQFLCIRGQCGLISHGLPRAHCGVIHWLLGAKRLLELLQYSD